MSKGARYSLGEMMRTKDSFVSLGAVAIILAFVSATILIPLAIYGGFAYVVIHFVKKFW